MDTIFMNSGNSKISDPHRLLLNILDKINLKRSHRYLVLPNRSIYYTCKNIKKLCKINKFKILAPTWNEQFHLRDRSYYVSDIQDYLEYIIKKHNKLTDNPQTRIYVNKTENSINS